MWLDMVSMKHNKSWEFIQGEGGGRRRDSATLSDWHKSKRTLSEAILLINIYHLSCFNSENSPRLIVF